MDERLNTSPQEDIHQFVTVTNNPFYKQNRPILNDLFAKSSQAKHGDYSLFDVQAELLGHIIAAESARKKYLRWKGWFAKALDSLIKRNAPLERIKDAQSRVDDMQQSATAARWFVGQLRSIGDGIAWRFLNYDRAVLRLLAEHGYVSVPEIGAGLYAEIEEFAHLAEQGYSALLNSITNFLRAGDITLYDKTTGKFRLVEVKAGELQTARTIRQGKHMALVQEGLDKGSHSITGNTITKIMCEDPLLTYVKILERTMAEAEQNLGSSRIFDEYLSFGVFCLRKLSSFPEEDAQRLQQAIAERCMSVISRKTDIPLRPMSNILPTVHFSRVLAPYTIFPIEQKRRFGLMTGDYFIISWLNVSGLARWLEKRGWRTEIILPLNKPPDSQLSRIGALKVWKTSSPKSIVIGLDILVLAAMEFWMPESIERIIVTGLNEAIPETDYSVYFPNVGKCAWD